MCFKKKPERAVSFSCLCQKFHEKLANECNYFQFDTLPVQLSPAGVKTEKHETSYTFHFLCALYFCS